MRDTAERRMKILETLCVRRHDTIKRLSEEFNVSERTIRYDIKVLECSYPIYTTQGTGGGVHVMDGYRLGMKYFTDEQTELLERISKHLNGKDLAIAKEMLKTFKRPLVGCYGFVKQTILQ